LHDYSFREWEGIMSDLYKNRWETYFKLLTSSSDKNKKLEIDWFDFDYAWIVNNKKYSTEPFGDPIEACVSIYNRYKNP
jgi:alpha-N-acetylglucosaminidase